MHTMSKFSLLAILFFFFSSLLEGVFSYPSYLMDEEGCAKPLAEGEMMMGKAIQIDLKKKVEIIVTKEDGSQYFSGDVYSPGEKVNIALVGVKGYHILETDAGSLQQGKCFGKRTASKNPVLQLPNDAKEVNMKVGWAKGYGTVKLSPTFTLIPPAEEQRVEEPSVIKQETETIQENEKFAARPGKDVTKMETVIDTDNVSTIEENNREEEAALSDKNEGINRKRKLRFH